MNDFWLYIFVGVALFFLFAIIWFVDGSLR